MCAVRKYGGNGLLHSLLASTKCNTLIPNCVPAAFCVSRLRACWRAVLLQVSQVVGRGFASLFNSYSGLPSSLEVRRHSLKGK
jgi:hypothetical protein